MEKPVLAMFNSWKPITLETDALDYTIGACISQPDNQGKQHPVTFYLKKLSPAELNYNIHNKELLAVVEAFNQWKHYLTGAKHQITVYSDYKNLTAFTTTKQLNQRQVYQAETLAIYNFKILYYKGIENSVTDTLLRRADHVEG